MAQQSKTVENKPEPDISFLISRGSQLLRQGSHGCQQNNNKNHCIKSEASGLECNKNLAVWEMRA